MSAEAQVRERTEETPELRRHVGRVGLLFASVGSIIGSGWLFGALNASQPPARPRSSPGRSAGS